MLFLSLTVTSTPQRCRSDNAAVITAVSILARLHRSGRAAVATGCYTHAVLLCCVASLVVGTCQAAPQWLRCCAAVLQLPPAVTPMPLCCAAVPHWLSQMSAGPPRSAAVII